MNEEMIYIGPYKVRLRFLEYRESLKQIRHEIGQLHKLK